jgi:hypothetical protein
MRIIVVTGILCLLVGLTLGSWVMSTPPWADESPRPRSLIALVSLGLTLSGLAISVGVVAWVFCVGLSHV